MRLPGRARPCSRLCVRRYVAIDFDRADRADPDVQKSATTQDEDDEPELGPPSAIPCPRCVDKKLECTNRDVVAKRACDVCRIGGFDCEVRPRTGTGRGTRSRSTHVKAASDDESTTTTVPGVTSGVARAICKSSPRPSRGPYRPLVAGALQKTAAAVEHLERYAERTLVIAEAAHKDSERALKWAQRSEERGNAALKALERIAAALEKGGRPAAPPSEPSESDEKEEEEGKKTKEATESSQSSDSPSGSEDEGEDGAGGKKGADDPSDDEQVEEKVPSDPSSDENKMDVSPPGKAKKRAKATVPPAEGQGASDEEDAAAAASTSATPKVSRKALGKRRGPAPRPLRGGKPT